MKRKVSWNWCSFLFAPYWFIYRKMYIFGAAILSGVFVLSFLGWFGLFFSIGGYITFGALGNYIYMCKVDKEIMRGNDMSEPFRSHYIRSVSGVNLVATILTAIGYALLILLINFA